MRARIDEAVAAAQRYASVEIVAVVARTSGHDPRAEGWAGWIAAVLAVGLVSGLELPSWVAILAVIVGYQAGVLAARGVPTLRRWLARGDAMRARVAARAEQMLYDVRYRRTSRAPALLLYVSLGERWAAVRAEPEVESAVGQAFLDELEDVLVGKVLARRPEEGLLEAVRAAGDRLAAALPRLAVDAGEPPNEIVMV
jgi:putative membrane protein